MSILIETAKKYLSYGINTMPAREDKRPVLPKWSNLQHYFVQQSEVEQMFSGASGLCVICGEISGNLEVLDIDIKYDTSGTLWSELCNKIQGDDLDLFDKLVIASTQNGGYHLIYRCGKIEGNNPRVAERYFTAEEIAAKNKEIDLYNSTTTSRKKHHIETGKRSLIETRGEGGYIIAAPTKGYKFIQGDLSKVARITEDERALLFDICRSFNECIEEPKKEKKVAPAAKIKPIVSESPIEQFNQTARIEDIVDFYIPRRSLTSDSNGLRKYDICNTPNGKTNGAYYEDLNAIYLFSSNYHPNLPTEQFIDAFDAYAYIHHRGDKKAAVSELIGAGAVTVSEKPKSKPQPKKEAEIRKEINDDDIICNGYFNILGFQKSDGKMVYYFKRIDCSTVISLTPSEMSAKNLATLAPLSYWEATYPSQREGVNTNAAASHLIELSIKKGYFDMNNIRGRGAYVEFEDDGYTLKNIIFHAGDKLIVNNEQMSLDDHDSEHVYEFAPKLNVNTKNALTKAEAEKFIDICESFSFKRPVDGFLLAGWCAIAPFGGALPWRPHIWISGESQSGKSTVYRDVIQKVLGDCKVSVQSNTSEAGIRQALGIDSLPLCFDEAESSSDADKARWVKIMDYVRAASSKDSPPIIKGGKDGQVKEYRPRSCFAFASIVYQASQQSDYRRIVSLQTKKLNNPSEFAALKAKQKQLLPILTNEYCTRLRARIVKLLPTILKNIEVANVALYKVIGNQGLADLIAPLLAGAYALMYDDVMKEDFALAFAEKIDWERETSSMEVSDKNIIMDRILMHKVRVQGSEYTISKLAAIAAYWDNDTLIEPKEAKRLLNADGLSVVSKKEDGKIYFSIAVPHEGVSRILSTSKDGGKYAKNYASLLESLEDTRTNQAVAIKVKTAAFGGITKPAIQVPLDFLITPTNHEEE